MASTEEMHLKYLRRALDEARKCTPVPTAFCVGCVIVAFQNEPEDSNNVQIKEDRKEVILSTGYSRELDGNTHAEANALSKAYSIATTSSSFPSSTHSDLAQPSIPSTIATLLETATVYTTLEPCSTRTSGLAPCANALVEAKVKEVVIGVGEPDDFVKCEGAKILSDAGTKVVWVKGLEDECLRVARGDFS